jgi:hypothetical protein
LTRQRLVECWFFTKIIEYKLTHDYLINNQIQSSILHFPSKENENFIMFNIEDIKNRLIYEWNENHKKNCEKELCSEIRNFIFKYKFSLKYKFIIMKYSYF